MNQAKQKTLTIIASISAVIGGLLLYISHKNKENIQLKADRDLTKQAERSKVVDGKVQSAQGEIDKLSQEMGKPAKSDDEFWDEYTKGKK